MIRQSDLPFQTIKEIYEQEFDLNEIFIQEEYKEIVNKLLLVSPSLVNKCKGELVNLGELSSRSKFSLAKYLIRMSSRSSTFQSLSKVSDNEIESDFISISVSIKWLRDLKEKVEKLQDSSSKMPFILSKHIRISELYYSSDYYCEEEAKQKNVKIAASSTLGKVLQWMLESTQVSYSDLFMFVLNLVEQHEKLTKQLLDSLIKYRYITSAITISSVSPEKIALLSEIAEFSPNKIKNKLHGVISELHNLMKVEDFSEININRIQSLSSKMLEISEKNQPLVIDSYYKNTYKNEIYDTNKIKEILEKLRAFTILTYDYQFIEIFEKIFIEEFGMFNEVPLDLIFINPKFEEKKIHQLVQNDTNLQKRRLDFDKKIARFISDAIVENRSIHLDELTSMVYDTKNDNIKVSVDVRVRKFGDMVYLPPSSVVFPAGSYSAKYKYLSRGSNLVKPYYIMDYLLNYVPDIGINYMANKVDNMICVDNIGDLKKFYIAMDMDGLYIRNCSDSKKILPVFQSLAKLDFINESYIARFLQKYTNTKVAPPIHFLTEKYEYFPYIPRIVHDDVVIFKESWNLFCEAKEDENILKYLCDFIKKYKIPEYVAIFEKGDEFPVSTTRELGLKIITQELKKKTQ
ncbi:lantibiotic dehydratase [Streptococcus sp. ZY1909104]|uniref:lantibiotic dehydratase n=1 Tax=Streptococcus sp. ZY1909104 TaxID=3233335 RepID=UPI00349F614B